MPVKPIEREPSCLSPGLARVQQVAALYRAPQLTNNGPAPVNGEWPGAACEFAYY